MNKYQTYMGPMRYLSRQVKPQLSSENEGAQGREQQAINMHGEGNQPLWRLHACLPLYSLPEGMCQGASEAVSC